MAHQGRSGDRGRSELDGGLRDECRMERYEYYGLGRISSDKLVVGRLLRGVSNAWQACSYYLYYWLMVWSVWVRWAIASG